MKKKKKKRTNYLTLLKYDRKVHLGSFNGNLNYFYPFKSVKNRDLAPGSPISSKIGQVDSMLDAVRCRNLWRKRKFYSKIFFVKIDVTTLILLI